jgi:hypothetical protein
MARRSGYRPAALRPQPALGPIHGVGGCYECELYRGTDKAPPPHDHLTCARCGHESNHNPQCSFRGVNWRCGCSQEQGSSSTALLDVERDKAGEPMRFWWCPAWGTLNAIRYHGEAGPDDPNCGKVSYYRVAR